MMNDRLSNGTEEGYKDARDICYNNGIAFFLERGSGVISFADFRGCVTVKVDALKKRADVISYHEKYNVPQDGTLPTLRERLRNHLAKVAKKVRHLNRVQLQPALAKASVICSASQDILLCADVEMRAIFQINLNFDGVVGVTIHGNVLAKCIS